MDIKNYWDKKIIEWEDSIVERKALSFVEKLAAYFREPLRFRTQTCLEIAKPFAGDKIILELGCGSGFFAFELSKLAKVKKIIGLDISCNAVNRAKETSKKKNLSSVCEFKEANVSSLAVLPEADLTVGLGFLDYLMLEEIKSIFEKITSKYFLFTFSEKKFSLLRYIHIFYLLSQRCPKHFYYTKKQIVNCIPSRFGNIKFINNKKLSFCCIVHNLPKL